MKGVRMQKANAMGQSPKVSGGGGNHYKSGNAGQGPLPGTHKATPTTMPRDLAHKTPKGTK